MHEWGITRDLLTEVLQQAANNRLNQVTRIVLALGGEAPLKAAALKACFQALARDTLLAQAKLQIKKTSGRAIIVQTIEGKTD